MVYNFEPEVSISQFLEEEINFEKTECILTYFDGLNGYHS